MPLGRDPAASQIAFQSFEEASLVCLRPYGSATLIQTFEFDCRLLLQ